jgi:hypothetical protein
VLFGGKIRGRRLPAGNYVLVVSATNAAGQSTSRSIAFTLLG